MRVAVLQDHPGDYIPHILLVPCPSLSVPSAGWAGNYNLRDGGFDRQEGYPTVSSTGRIRSDCSGIPGAGGVSRGCSAWHGCGSWMPPPALNSRLQQLVYGSGYTTRHDQRREAHFDSCGPAGWKSSSVDTGGIGACRYSDQGHAAHG